MQGAIVAECACFGFGRVNSATDPQGAAAAEDSLDKSIRVYREMGFPDRRVADLMVRSGFPVEAVQRRFPGVSLSEVSAPSRTQPTRKPPGPANSHTDSRSLDPARRPEPIGRSGGLRTVVSRLDTPRACGAEANSTQRAVVADVSAVSSGGADGLSFQYVPLIQCTFPHGDPGEQTSFSRRNGHLELELTTKRPQAGLPYGVPARLLTIYCASEVKRTQSPRIDLGVSVHDFLRRLDVPITRGERGSLRVYTNQLMRLIHCIITIDEDIEDSTGRKGLDIHQALFVDEARLWWDEDFGVGDGSYLLLTAKIFESILARSAPLSTRAIRALRKSPMDLDVYAWLVHRLYNRFEPSTVTWKQLFGQFGHTYGEIRYFRKFFCRSLTKAMQEYPEARVKVTDTGLLLLPSKPHIAPRTGELV